MSDDVIVLESHVVWRALLNFQDTDLIPTMRQWIEDNRGKESKMELTYEVKYTELGGGRVRRKTKTFRDILAVNEFIKEHSNVDPLDTPEVALRLTAI